MKKILLKLPRDSIHRLFPFSAYNRHGTVKWGHNSEIPTAPNIFRFRIRVRIRIRVKIRVRVWIRIKVRVRIRVMIRT